jgi:hypothetical protein
MQSQEHSQSPDGVMFESEGEEVDDDPEPQEEEDEPDEEEEPTSYPFDDVSVKEDEEELSDRDHSFRSAGNEPGAGSTIVFMDIEWHWTGDDATPISQICAVSLDTMAVLFNEYVFYRPLHRDWLELTREHGVVLSPWNDPAQAKSSSLKDVCERLLGVLRYNTVLVFKGTKDMRSILCNLGRAHAPAFVTTCAAKRIRYASIDGVWTALLKSFLSPRMQSCLLNSNGSPRTERAVYTALFWSPVLVVVMKDGEEEVVNEELPPACVAFPPCIPLPALRAEFEGSGRRMPVFHTAHTDTLVMRNITCMLLILAENRYSMHNAVRDPGVRTRGQVSQAALATVTSGDMAISLLTTYAVRKTRWLRTKNLGFTSTGANQLAKIVAAAAREVEGEGEKEEEEGESTQPYDEGGAGLVPSSTPGLDGRKAYVRKTKEGQPGIPVLHKGRRTLLAYSSSEGGRDAGKERAMRALIGAGKEGSVYDAIEQARKLVYPRSAPIGHRPWYYAPTATGAQGPGIQLLHTRDCIFADAEKKSMAVYDFDHIQGAVPLFELRFCKTCKKYEEQGPGRAPLLPLVSEDDEPVPSSFCPPLDPDLATILALFRLIV